MPIPTLADWENGKLDLNHVAAVATSTSPTATDRLGNVKMTMQGASDAVAAKVQEVEDEKNTAVNTTIPAKVAQVDAAVAATYVGLAIEAKTDGELARDAALAATKVFPDTASGLAAVANGEYFYVPSSDVKESLILYRDNAGVAIEVKRFYSAAALDAFYDGTYDRPDRIWSWHDSDRNEVAHINEKAELNDHHTNISLEVGGLREIVCFGDSLTQGNGWDAADSMPMILQGLTGWRTYNRGVSAFSALRIATTQGGVVSLMSFPNNTIPAAGAVEVSAYTNPIRGDIGVRTISGYLLYGGLKIPGVIQHTGIYPAGNPRQGQDIYTFTRTTAGDAIEVDPKTPFIVDQNGDDYRIQVWWSGRNGYGADPTGATLISYYKRMRDILKPARERFVILGIINGWGWNEFPGGVPIPSGGGELGYNQILTINNNVKQEFPDNFIDVQKRLVRSVKNSVDPLDIEDYNRDVVPRSLAPDGLHLNMPGKTIVAQSAYDFFLMKGWLE